MLFQKVYVTVKVYTVVEVLLRKLRQNSVGFLKTLPPTLQE